MDYLFSGTEAAEPALYVFHQAALTTYTAVAAKTTQR